jgi:hypothetical protein
LLAGDPAAAERELRRGLEILEPRGSDGYQQALLAETLYRQARYDEAAGCVAAAAAKDAEGVVLSQVMWRSVRAKLDHSESIAREALALAERTDAPNLVADALVDLAIVSDGADDLLVRALELYEQKGNASARALVSDRVPTAVRSHDGD